MWSSKYLLTGQHAAHVQIELYQPGLVKRSKMDKSARSTLSCDLENVHGDVVPNLEVHISWDNEIIIQLTSSNLFRTLRSSQVINQLIKNR